MSKNIIRTTEEMPEEKLVEFCSEYLPEISENTGIPISTLKDLSGEYQMRVYVNYNSEAFSISAVNRIVGEGIYDQIIRECAEFMNISKSELDRLDDYTQEQVIGSFDMQRELVPDEQLRTELFELMNSRKAGTENEV